LLCISSLKGKYEGIQGKVNKKGNVSKRKIEQVAEAKGSK